MTITTALIKELREKTGAGILDCRQALEQAHGDLDKAADLLRQKGLAAAMKRAHRETRNGVLELYTHGDGRVGVMVEVNCETDFVARTKEFRQFAHEIALQIAANAPRYLRVEDIPQAVLEIERKEVREKALADGKPDAVIERIFEGRMENYAEEYCLLRQPYIRDETKSVEQLLQEVIATTGENVAIRRFVRWMVGELQEESTGPT
ncbi:MAG TPA: translation elongation factor Ts [Anaerolineales bacterium]|nr:translation elongation factor Ts [Anaerolineales bacterium]